jgi:hypothetical protein
MTRHALANLFTSTLDNYNSTRVETKKPWATNQADFKVNQHACDHIFNIAYVSTRLVYASALHKWRYLQVLPNISQRTESTFHYSF